MQGRVVRREGTHPDRGHAKPENTPCSVNSSHPHLHQLPCGRWLLGRERGRGSPCHLQPRGRDLLRVGHPMGREMWDAPFQHVRAHTRLGDSILPGTTCKEGEA